MSADESVTHPRTRTQVMHLPGHSPGSVALFDAAGGVVATGDTVYETDGELIDWYPGSSVLAMRRSVRRLLDVAATGGSAAAAPRLVALPGHNGVIEGAERLRAACERHLEMAAAAARTVKKAALSRPRAAALLALNSRVAPVPEWARDWMKT